MKATEIPGMPISQESISSLLGQGLELDFRPPPDCRLLEQVNAQMDDLVAKSDTAKKIAPKSASAPRP